MKHSIIKILTLILALVMCLGTVACGGETDGTGTSQNPNGNENNNSNGNVDANASEDELFAAVKAAYEAYANIDEAFTFRGVQKQTRKSAAYGEMIYTANIESSCDYASNRFIQVLKSYNGEVLADTEFEKHFEKDGGYYLCKYEEETGEEAEKEYYQYFDRDAMLNDLEIDEMHQSFAGYAGGAFIADSFAELKSSFDTVIPTLLANELTYMKREGTFKDGETMTLVPDVSVSYAADGTVVLALTLTLNASAMGEGGQEMKNVCAVMERKFSAKDGKLTTLDVKMDMSFQSLAENGAWTDNGSTLEMKIDIEHSFDEALYNSLEVSLPSNPEEIEKKTHYFSADCVLGDVAYGMSVSVNENVDEMLNVIENSLTNRFDYFDHETDSFRSALTVKGLYQDAALTKKIDSDSMSLEDILELETVYVDYEIAEGYAVVKRESEEQVEISRPYQIVYVQLYGYGSERMDGNVFRAGESYNLSFTPSRDEAYKVLVNGVETTAQSLTMEGGKIYEIAFISIIKDKDLGLSHVINF